MNDEIKMRIRTLRDQPGQTDGIVAACNAVLSGTAAKSTRTRILDLAR